MLLRYTIRDRPFDIYAGGGREWFTRIFLKYNWAGFCSSHFCLWPKQTHRDIIRLYCERYLYFVSHWGIKQHRLLRTRNRFSHHRQQQQRACEDSFLTFVFWRNYQIIMLLQKFTSKEIKPEFIEVHGTNIPCKNEVKLLGITIDDKLKVDK